MISVIYVLLLFLFPLPALIFVYWHNLYKKQVRQEFTFLAVASFVFSWSSAYYTGLLADNGVTDVSMEHPVFLLLAYIFVGAQIALNWYTTSSSQT